MLTDTHCHLDMERFDADRDSVITRAIQSGVRRMLVPSLDLHSAERVLNLSQVYPAIYAAVGFHPAQRRRPADSQFAALQQLVSSAKVVAIGEIGLDYYWVTESQRRREQQTHLRLQLDLAERHGLPVVLHMREENDAERGACTDDMLRILADWVAGLRSRGSPLVSRPGVLHSFSGTLETAMKAIELGFHIGITGPITYPNALKRREAVRALPLNRLLIETDAPFLAPQRHRGMRNEPAFVADIADRIASVQSRTASEVAEATSSNAARLFAWGEPD